MDGKAIVLDLKSENALRKEVPSSLVLLVFWWQGKPVAQGQVVESQHIGFSFRRSLFWSWAGDFWRKVSICRRREGRDKIHLKKQEHLPAGHQDLAESCAAPVSLKATLEHRFTDMDSAFGQLSLVAA